MRGKYLVLLRNRIRFDSSQFSTDAIVRESVTDWHRISTEAKFEVPYSVVKATLQLQDLAVNLDDLTELEDSSIFDVE